MISRRARHVLWGVGVASAAAALLPVLSSTPARASAGCAPAAHPGGEWRSYGHDLSNSRVQDQETVITPARAATLEPAFTFSAAAAAGLRPDVAGAGSPGDITGTPVVADGCLFTATNRGWVLAANADDGQPVWATKLTNGGGVNSTPLVTGGQVFVGVARGSSPYVAALDQTTGDILWETLVDDQAGSEIYGSPVVFDGVLAIGVSGGSAELGDEADRYAFQGSIVLLETGLSPAATEPAGTLLFKRWTIRAPDADPTQPADEFAGAAVWSTGAVDPVRKAAYFGTGNPFRPQAEHDHANAIVQLDLDRSSASFGEIVSSYKGDVDEYLPHFSELPCFDIPGNPAPYYPQGIGECGDLDMDFGASPNLFTAPDGSLLVGAGQKSGVYHVADASTMEPAWSQVLGPPSAIGGIVGSTAVDGDAVYGPIVPAGYLWSIERDGGLHRWASPVGDGAHWGNPVAVANGVVYTTDLKGFLDAYDARTGAPLLHRPMKIGSDTGSDPVASWGGVSVARNTVYASVGITALSRGYVVAFRPSSAIEPPELPAPPGLPDAPPVTSSSIAAGPMAQFYGYLTPAAVAAGAPVTFTNADIVRHDVVQDPGVDGVAGPDDQPWCNRFPAGECPVFWTPLIGLGESADVEGLENAEPGRLYSFYCTLHPGMKGKLVVAS